MEEVVNENSIFKEYIIKQEKKINAYKEKEESMI